MERLLELAKSKVDSAELYHISTNNSLIDYENFQLSNMKSSLQSGYCLRVIKDGRLGVSYTKNLLNPKELVDNALNTLKGNVKGEFKLSSASDIPKLDTFSSEVESYSSEKAVNFLQEISDYVASKTDNPLNLSCGYGESQIRIINTEGLDVTAKKSFYNSSAMLMFPNSQSALRCMSNSIRPEGLDKGEIDQMIERYLKSLPEVSIESTSMPVIFAPSVMYSLMWRLTVACNAKSLYENISPLKSKVGERVFSEKLTIYDDPHMNLCPTARAFDDEGVPTKRFSIIEHGVFKGFYNDLNYAARLNMTPTGHGYKTTMWGGDPIATPVNPYLLNLTMATGDESLEEMIKKVDKGILLTGVLGAHSGNIANGDISVGINPGLYIERGEIVGRIKDGMFAGNIYDMMKRVISVEDRVHDAGGGRYPAVLIDDIKVTN